MDAYDPNAEPAAPAADTAPPEVRRRRVPWRALLIFALVVAAVGVAVWWMGQRGQRQAAERHGAEAGRDAPVLVTDAAASRTDIGITLEALGTVTPLATVTVRARIEGHLVQIGFREGQHVHKGDFLAQIDPRPYQAALDQAKGQLARDQALLRNAEVDLVRYRNLVAEDSIARQQLDTQESLVRQYRAAVQVDEAQVETAALNLEYCRIVSPIDGRVGLRQVDLGNYVRTSDTSGIVVITQMQPMSVVFTIPQDDLPKVLARMRGGAALPVDAYDRDGTTKIATGVLETIDNQIDTATGTIRLRATFNNADEQLFPNQFVNVRMLVDTLHNVVAVPPAAVQRGPQGKFVYVIGADDKAAVRLVKVGASERELVQITAGVEPGERVVTDGIDRLRDGITVTTTAPATTPVTTPATKPATAAGTPATVPPAAVPAPAPAPSGRP